ncbi:TPA-induced transmembrane protein-like [Megalops cyprinoides]|uniref:TPA-induced transmembrane protein-like n=1 Tax=Megalops cyprinoides TaxID=118141 RepID=UPI0018654F33|nr:TPA-induced transmembrane protein-like [Megalops cyprinoides]
MNVDIELKQIPPKENDLLDNNNWQNERAVKQQVTTENGDSSHDTQEATENSHLLSADQTAVTNGAQCAHGGSVSDGQDSCSITLEESSPHTGQIEPSNGQKKKCLYSNLNEVVVWKLKLWMVISLIFLLIITVIVLALVLYSVVYTDEDDTFNRELFVVPRIYSGTLRLVNQEFSEDLRSPTSPQSQALSTQLKEKLSDLYSSSPALGRYFSSAGMYEFRNGSVTAYYWLKFLIPQEHNQLVRYTLSQEMVYNVLRQYLYDQEPDTKEPFYIDPASAYMQVGNTTVLE